MPNFETGPKSMIIVCIKHSVLANIKSHVGQYLSRKGQDIQTANIHIKPC